MLTSSTRSLSGLLSAFGAITSPTSATEIRRNLKENVDPGFGVSDPHATLSQTPSSDAEHTEPIESGGVKARNNADDTIEALLISDSDDGSEDCIVVSSRLSTRELKPRAAKVHPAKRVATVSSKSEMRTVSRSRVLRARAKSISTMATSTRRSSRRKSDYQILTSDAIPTAPAKRNVKPDTIRNRTRATIAATTKSRRDIFLIQHEDHFAPLLPRNNYIGKLKNRNAVDVAHEIVPYELLTRQPRGVRAQMKDYQLEGLSFLVHMFKNGMSTILGDEMGLGKTLQTLSLFQFLAEDDLTSRSNEPRPHIVVCPLSVLSSWMNEARKWVPDLRTVRFHGPKSERETLKKSLLADKRPIGIIVTTYETFVAEQNWFKRAFAWRYCVLDEGHKVKNAKSEVSSALQSLQAEFRLLLTGTPLQNNLHEMWALLHWLYPDVFGQETAETFKNAFDLTRGKVSTTIMDAARRLLELIMLRRMKSSPGVNLGLPTKTEVLLFVPLTPLQRFWYTRLITKMDNAMFEDLYKDVKSKAIDSLQKDEETDKHIRLLEQSVQAIESNQDQSGPKMTEAAQMGVLQNSGHADAGGPRDGDWRKLMNLVMQLRKVCSHPYLLTSALPDPYELGDHVVHASGKFIMLEKIIDELVVRRGKKVLIFSGFCNTLNLCEDLLMMKGANRHEGTFRYSRLDGSTARARRNLAIRQFNDAESLERVMLISTRAGGLGINLCSASDVIFLDEDWNPQITLQAEARAHRIGQTHPVTVYKICTQGTVEEQMMGRIRKKLYLSAKITESMRNLYRDDGSTSRKRKRQSENELGSANEDAPQLDTSQLKSLLRRGAETLVRPSIDVTDMLDWDFETMLAKCRDQTEDGKDSAEAFNDKEEEEWLNSMEKVETAIFEGRKHHRELAKQTSEAVNLNRADRRDGKNTTVMINGFAVNKESLECGEWEAVPTMAGKDPRLAEPVRAPKPPIIHQEHCQSCRDGGDLICCHGCPRTYHFNCLDSKAQARSKGPNYFCPQHECADCEAKTAEAGGMLYRCRWCESAFCEDCLDWENTELLGDTVPELEMLGYSANERGYYVNCPRCVQDWKQDPAERARIEGEREDIDDVYRTFLGDMPSMDGTSLTTPMTVSELATPSNEGDMTFGPPHKKPKLS